jgi:serine/threonine protein kinase
MPTAADRNLLFGILALQMDFISRDQLVAAMNAWVLAKHKALGDILNEQGALDAEQHGLLTAMVRAHLKKHGNDPEKSLAAVPVSSGLKEQIQSLADADVQASLGHLAGAGDPDATRSWSVGTSMSVGTSTSVDTSMSAGTRFRILRPHAKGGLGEVFVAEDLELHREVALKEILGRHAGHADSRGRFVLEAEITGGLEHPGIVPVYGLGAYADGRPFYAMRFIRGDNLKEAIARFHRSPTRKRGAEHEPVSEDGPLACASGSDFTSLEFRQLLGRFIDVCNAVAYAHSRGVLHRDLKPGNVMLGKFGETLIVDWGLAKAGVRGQGLGVREETAESVLRPGSGSGVAETVAGTAIGTPAYMSPEQAAGKLDQLGPATDLYSLGATLYTLLTNRPPINGSDSAEVLRQAQRGEAGFAAPGASTTGIPAPLVAICQKAMSLSPRDRYATPLALAEDLEHWLADEPVKAAPDPLLVRTRRWMRKHPGPVSGIAAAVLVSLVGLAIGAAVLREKNQLLSHANTQLDAKNTELKTSNRQLDAANSDLKTTNANLVLAREKAEKATDAEREATKKEREATELALDRLGQIEKANQLMESIFTDIDPRAGEKGGPLLIEQLTKRLLATADKLDEQAIRDPLAVARLRNFLGKTLRSLGEPNKAIELHARARAAFEERLGPDHPDTLTSMNNLALGYQATGKLDLALPLYQETLKRTAANLGPDHPDTLTSMNNQAVGYQAAGKLDLALPLWEETLKLRRAKLGPDHPDTVQSMSNLAVGYQAAGKLDLALPLLQETLKLMRAKLGPDHPHTLTSMNNLALGYKAAGKLDLALLLFEQTLKLRKAKLGADHPHTLNSMNSLASGYHAAGKLDLALPLFEETLKLTKAKLGPDHPNTLRNMNNLAQGYRAAGKLDLGLLLLQDAAAGMEKQRFQHEYALAIVVNLIACHEQLKQFDQAEPWRRKWLAVVKERSGADSLAYAGELAGLGLNLLGQKKSADAEAVLRECLGLRQKKAANAWSTFNAQAMLGASLLGQKKYKEGEPLLTQGYEGMKQREKTIPPQSKVRLIEAAERLVELYQATGRKEEAAKWTAVVASLEGKLIETVHNVEKVLTLKGELDKATPGLIYLVRLQAGVTYVIDMVSPDPKALDPYLVLQDLDRKTLAQDDDSGGNKNARITFRAPADAIYRLRATSFGAGRGPFTLTLKEQKPEKPAANEPTPTGAFERAQKRLAEGKAAEAIKLFEQVYKQREEKRGRDHSQMRSALHGLGRAYLAYGERNRADAETALRASLAVRGKKADGLWSTFNTQCMLGGALRGRRNTPRPSRS